MHYQHGAVASRQIDSCRDLLSYSGVIALGNQEGPPASHAAPSPLLSLSLQYLLLFFQVTFEFQ